EDQRFRLKYVLGDLPYEGADDASDLAQDSEKRDLAECRRAAAGNLEGFVERLRILAQECRGLAEHTAGAAYAQLGSDQQLAFEEEVDGYLDRNEAFEQLTGDILQAVEERFRFVDNTGSLSRDEDAWPRYWSFKHDDRHTFLRTMNYFTSNHAERYGTLLTPLVDGIRVKGPFKAAWLPDLARCLIIDGEV